VQVPASYVWGFGRALWDPKVRAYGLKPLRAMVLGPAAAGKTVLCEMLSQTYGVPCINVGDLLYEEVAKGSALGREAKQYMEGSSTVPDKYFMQVRARWHACLKAAVSRLVCWRLGPHAAVLYGTAIGMCSVTAPCNICITMPQ
jgi:hypothetical protein